MPRTTFGPSTRSQSSCNSPIGCCFRPGDTRPPGAGTSCAGESGGQRTFSIAIAVAFLGRPRAAPINRHSPDSGQSLGQSHPLDRLGQGQIVFVAGKRRSKPAVDGTATLIRAVLPESRPASPLVARAFDLPGSSCRRGWCSQPGDQGQVSANICRETATSAIWKVTVLAASWHFSVILPGTRAMSLLHLVGSRWCLPLADVRVFLTTGKCDGPAMRHSR